MKIIIEIDNKLFIFDRNKNSIPEILSLIEGKEYKIYSAYSIVLEDLIKEQKWRLKLKVLEKIGMI